MNKKYITPELALVKLQQYCAYQERCHQEVRSKLIELGIYGDALEEIIAQLILRYKRLSKKFQQELPF